jgi:hypothetical protein
LRSYGPGAQASTPLKYLSWTMPLGYAFVPTSFNTFWVPPDANKEIPAPRITGTTETRCRRLVSSILVQAERSMDPGRLKLSLR